MLNYCHLEKLRIQITFYLLPLHSRPHIELTVFENKVLGTLLIVCPLLSCFSTYLLEIESYFRLGFHLLSLLKHQNQSYGYCLTVYISQFSTVMLFDYLIQYNFWIQTSYLSILFTVM